MHTRTITAVYALLVGVAILGLWSMLLATDQVPERETEPLTITYHLVAETLTALALIMSGYGLLRRRRWASRSALLSFGLLLYTTINSTGYYVEWEEWAVAAMFSVLTLLTLVLVGLTWRMDGSPPGG
ncbi:MAG: hypothetical protein PHU95_03230 [Candidatus Thermoplasmatota archaeon]|nr:hypothetical protein [Candidatus Thermoplasmatota archaeon]